MNTFRGAVKVNDAGELKILNLKIPELRRGQVLLKMKYASLCRSQIMEIRGLRGIDNYIPHLLGHEGLGTVIGIGEGVDNFWMNRDVIIGWQTSDGLDCDTISFQSTDGNLVNAGKCTVFSELTVVAENRIYEKPRGLSDEVASYYGCGFLTGIGMAMKHSGEQNMRYLVWGLGGVGLGSLLFLAFSGATNITVVEPNPSRTKILETLRKYGVSVRSISSFDLEKENGFFDTCFESGGSVSSIESAFKMVTPGGTLVFASHPPQGEKVQIDPFDLICGKKIYGTWGGGFSPNFILSQISNNLINFSNKYLVPSNYFLLEEINVAFEKLEQGLEFRPVIKF